MILALNVGNTHVGYGFVEDGRITSTGSAPTPPADRAFELEMAIDEALGRVQGADGALEIVVASVVPSATEALRELATRRRWELLEATEDTVPMAKRLGAEGGAGNDRLINAFAAWRLYGAPAIVVDLGTATTFDVVDAGGGFLGGAIAPGVGLEIDALATGTAQLPRVRIALPPRAIGRNTTEAIQSGTVLGHVGMVEFLIRAISGELPSDGPAPMVILTGGLSSHTWAGAIHGVTAIDPLLTLRGLALMHQHYADARRAQPASA